MSYNISDEDTLYLDIPELDEELIFYNAKLIQRKPTTEVISIYLDTDIPEQLRNIAKKLYN